MSTNKVLLREKVLTSGAGRGRAVLCFDSGLIYSYDDPSYIVGLYHSGKGWITLQRPHYSRGGWGSGSTGDLDGYNLVSNARSLVYSIGGTIYELNSKQFLTPLEIKEINREIENNNKLIKKQNAVAARLGRTENIINLNNVETLKLRLESSQTKNKKGINAVEVALKYEKALEVFLNRKGKSVKVDTYLISQDVVKQDKTLVAFRDSIGQIFMNSQVLNISSFERNFLGNQSIIQKKIREVAKFSIPFNVLESADLKLNETKIIEQGPESTHSLRNGERHFTGALLMENSGRKFLMDIDREEIQHGIFNAFFVEVNSNVNSISQAYDSMKPQVVKDAEEKGIEVRRQGEWFFIKTEETLKIKDDLVYSSTWSLDREETKPKQYLLHSNVSHGKGRPNSLLKPIGFNELDQYVCGVVKHSGREHKDLDLGVKEIERSEMSQYDLWILVPNTTVSNFTISGEVD